ncbi:glycosyltransferase family 2 protein [Desulfovibrio sp.]|uniref:glycosyltransferase family 2 protein n=1 Tax=Desulfovibrio sp. TaxID=885 RepID=UPI0025C67FFF|nr:glycosyltransferase family 2 protein [Desulfovibrio sp.]
MLLNAVLCVWNEEDVIAATVRHAFAQGCSNVFIVDNASEDGTVPAAVEAGAVLAASFGSKYFNEDLKVTYLNEVVRRWNAQHTPEQVWWLFADADEFPALDCGLRLVDFLDQLDPAVRGVQGHLYNHWPTHQPYLAAGRHPADFMPLCDGAGGGKLPLLRYDSGHPHLWSIGGAHDVVTHGGVVPVVQNALHIHHFPHRKPETTFARLKKLVFRNDDGTSRTDWHDNFLKQVGANVSQYNSRHAELTQLYSSHLGQALLCASLPYDFKRLVRWYDAYDDAAFAAQPLEQSLCKAVYYFFLEEYDIALCRFNDALDVCDDAETRLRIMVKMAECLAHSSAEEARVLLMPLVRQGSPAVNAYISTCCEYILAGNCAPEVQRDSTATARIGVCQSVFPEGVAQGYAAMAAEIAGNFRIFPS